MNYRRGFQRLYAVIAATWVVVLLLVLPSGRLRFWNACPGQNSWGDCPVADYLPPLLTDADIDRPDAKEVSHLPPGWKPEDAGKPKPDLWEEARKAFQRGERPWEIWENHSNIPPPPPGFTLDAATPTLVQAPDGDFFRFPASMKTPDIESAMRKLYPSHSPILYRIKPVGKAFFWLAGVLFGPPLFGYAALFFLIPWIYRGFRPPPERSGGR